MNKNKNIKKNIMDYDFLLVASRINRFSVETESFIQYETFGNVDHYLLVSQKKELVIGKKDGDKIRYYNMDGIEIEEYQRYSSYKTCSSVLTSLQFMYYDTCIPLLDKDIVDLAKKMCPTKGSYYGYFIPFDEYIKQELGYSLKSVTPIKAWTVLKFINMCKGKPMVLSFDEDESKKQLEQIGYYVKEKVKTLK